MRHIKNPRSSLYAIQNGNEIDLGQIELLTGNVPGEEHIYSPAFRIATDITQHQSILRSAIDTVGNIDNTVFRGLFYFDPQSGFTSEPNSNLNVPFLLSSGFGASSTGLLLNLKRNDVEYNNDTHGFVGQVSLDFKLPDMVNRTVTNTTSVHLDNISRKINTVAKAVSAMHADNAITSSMSNGVYLASTTGVSVGATIERKTDSNNDYQQIGDIRTHKVDFTITKRTNTAISKLYYYGKNGTGTWLFDLDQFIIDKWSAMAIGKSMRLRFVIAVSNYANYDELEVIGNDVIDATLFRKPITAEQVSINEDNTTVTYKFDVPCYVSVMLNNILIADRLRTTNEGEISVNFNTDLTTGNNVILKAYTFNETETSTNFNFDYADTSPPPMIEPDRFTSTKIYGHGGEANAIAIAKRDDIEIGRVQITGSLEFIIELNDNITLSTGDLVELYAIDTAGNPSESELYEIEVSVTTDGTFNQDLGNDSLTSTLQVY